MAETPTQEETPATTGVDENTAPIAPVEGKMPGWEGDFDPDRAARLVNNLREESKKSKDELTDLRKKLADKEDAEKSEFQRLQDRAVKAETELNETRSALLIAEIGKEFGVPAELLSGANREEIAAKAKALADWAAVTKRPSDDMPSKPKARLMQGFENGDKEGEAFDAQATIAKIRDRF